MLAAATLSQLRLQECPCYSQVIGSIGADKHECGIVSIEERRLQRSIEDNYRGASSIRQDSVTKQPLNALKRRNLS